MNAGRSAVTVALFGVWALVLGTTFRLAAITSPYLPKFDDWPIMTPALTGRQAVTPQWLWEPHNAHRIALPRLAYLAAFDVSGGDFRAAQFLGVGLLGLAALLGMGLARHWRGSSHLADAFFPLILLHWGQSHLFLLGTVLNFTIAIVLNYCALFLLLRAGDQFNRKHCILLACCLTGMALSGMVGVLLAIPYLIWLGGVGWRQIRQGGSSRKNGWFYLAMLVTLAIIVSSPFFGLPLVSKSEALAAETSSSLPLRLHNLAIIMAMGLGWLAKSYFLTCLCIMLGISLAAAAWLAFVLRTRREDRCRASALLLFMSGIVGVLASVGYARAFVTGEALWATTRYAAFPVALLIGGFLGSFFLRRRQAIFQTALCALAGIVFVGAAIEADGYPYARQTFLDVRAHEDALIRSVLSGGSLEQAARDFFVHQNGYSPRRGAEWLAMLRDRRLGLFGMSERESAQFFDWWEGDAEAPLIMKRPEADRFLGDGWSVQGNPDGRWTSDKRATIRFRVDPARPHSLSVRMLPFVAPGKLDRQRVSLALNGQALTTLVLDRWDWQTHAVSLPTAWLRAHNTLELALPDAIAPRSIGYNGDPEPHGVLVQSIAVTSVEPPPLLGNRQGFSARPTPR